ncbi:MAG: septum formation protein Maf [Bacteroidia bacterium]
MKILLGSNSPRRSQLLAQMGIEFEKVNIDCEERTSHTDPRRVAQDLALQKSMAYDKLLNDELLITADTIVNLNGEILHKPKDKQEAHKMLASLSAKSHSVLTAVCLRTSDSLHEFVEESQVHFNRITTSEINYYIDNYKPYDKAGAYGIQEWIGSTKIKGINGCYYNVIGLPCARLYEYLLEYYPQYVSEKFTAI